MREQRLLVLGLINLAREASAPASPSRGPGNGILRAETGSRLQAQNAGERPEFGSQTEQAMDPVPGLLIDNRVMKAFMDLALVGPPLVPFPSVVNRRDELIHPSKLFQSLTAPISVGTPRRITDAKLRWPSVRSLHRPPCSPGKPTRFPGRQKPSQFRSVSEACRGLRTEFRPFSRVLRLSLPASLSPQNSVSRTTRWRGRSRR